MNRLSFFTLLILGLLSISMNAQNTAVGVSVGNTGSYNSNFGELAGNGSTGNFNVAVGYKSLNNPSTGSYNVMTGVYTGYHNSTGEKNVIQGYQAGYFNTTGYKNIFTGYQSGYANTTGYYNVYDGYQAGYYSTSAHDNTFVGTAAGFTNATGLYNCFIGSTTGYNSTGSNNTFAGTGTGYYNSTGTGNTFFGFNAGNGNYTGTNNTCIGREADLTNSAFVNAMALGYGTKVSASNKVVVGNTAVTSIGGQVGWTTYSDKRLKKNIEANALGLDFILKLKPVTYEYIAEGQKDIRYHGLIAQEVDAAAKGSFSGVDKNGEYWGIRYAELTVPLIKAVQEQQTTIVAQSQTIQTLENRLKAIEQAMSQLGVTLPSVNETAKLTNSTFSLDSEYAASLAQNAPNPFQENTTIEYFIPTTASAARLDIMEMNGKVIKSIELSEKGEGKITFENNTLSAATYLYSLVIDNQIVATKKMTIAK